MCDDILYVRNSAFRPDICHDCFMKIKIIKPPICMKCGKPVAADEKELCRDCSTKNFLFKRGVAAFSYSAAMKSSMYAFKYNNRREYGKYYAEVIEDRFYNTVKSWNCEVLIPVPLHKSKYLRRGYNQAEVLAAALSRCFNLPVDSNILIRTRNTRPQKELSDSERRNNIENAFQTRTNSLKYKKIILVDDIYTTGTTINECAGALKHSGAEEVYFITACIGNGF